MMFTNNFSRLFEDVGHMLNEFQSQFPSTQQVAVNVWSNDDQVIVQAELPGVNPKHIQLEALKDQLHIQAERNEEIPEHVKTHVRERSAQQIDRHVQLPYEVKPASAKAEFKDGILHITFKRLVAEKPTSIKIKVK